MSTYHTWIEVDTEILEKNIVLMKSKLGKGVDFAGLVKANAYGHGLTEVAKMLIRHQARFIAVAYFEEAMKLRKDGINYPILMLTQPFEENIQDVIHYNITPAIYSIDIAKQIGEQALKTHTIVPLHIKVDTGLHRLGFSPEKAAAAIIEISKIKGIRIEGIYTHFVNSYALDVSFTQKQIQLYEDIIAKVGLAGIHPTYLHTANSAAHVWIPKSQYNLVRFGLTMYGLQPSDEKGYPLAIQQCFTWKTRILQTRHIKKGENVGYGNLWHAPKDMQIATLAVGYADGFRRTPHNYGVVLCGGQKVPIISNVQMSQTMIDVSTVKQIRERDEVVIIGKQGHGSISFEDIANVTRTTNEEIATSISAIIPRIYR